MGKHTDSEEWEGQISFRKGKGCNVACSTCHDLAAEERANAFFTGQIIEDARKKANITQEELAARIGTNKSYISRVETGRTEPKVSTFYRIIAALGLTVELTPAV